MKGGYRVKLSKRQEQIAQIVREEGPVTGSAIAEHLEVTRSALRSDLSVLTMLGVLDARPNVGYYYVGLSKETQTAERLKSFLVSDVLSQAVVVNGDTSLYDTIVTLFTEDVGTILVCDGSYLVGVVSRKDLLRASMGQTDSHTMPISMIMTPVSKVIAVEPTDTLVEAAQKMIDYEVDCLPVVVREDVGNKKRLKVVGRVSKTTVAKVFLECSIQKIIYAISDSLGETAEAVARATASQYDKEQIEIVRVPYIDSESQIDEVIDDAKRGNHVICHTIVSASLRKYLHEKVAEYNIPAVDIMGPVLDAVGTIATTKPRMTAGMVHKLDQEYFKKVEAIEFAVKYDDGKNPSGFEKADIVIIGVSRTSKTPLSMFLAYKKIKAANLPLVPEVPLPEELFKIPAKKIVGLIIDPYKLNNIRSERLRAIGLEDEANYASIERIQSELDYAKAIMRRLHCQVLDVSNKSIEETASLVMQLIDKNRASEGK